jgi:hypothetical protein
LRIRRHEINITPSLPGGGGRGRGRAGGGAVSGVDCLADGRDGETKMYTTRRQTREGEREANGASDRGAGKGMGKGARKKCC